ncbi:Gfo/Idh/MocA family oxidoreductase [Paenibacillus lycopersici]|uniref:Gfo/Idh/MocA family oxidoreductase n=1 Tax=Paenibacillus lycopersici TaxID=2704462 RepID=A0A6C0FZ11_9BACL|nr:Gfo/Idh/MocA family oxidoreductase [Paenibacillus lycopersici]QHT62368.1 Gfo/Idh/MocA family oxidoreductase [Paenibacillus lycopersici]
MTKLTASVVGGGAGGLLSMKALAASDRFELAAAADLRPEICERLRAQFPGIQTFTDHHAMFAQCPTDIVCVSTFPPSHEEVAMDALRLPLKGILVEKPLGHTVASGRAILEAIKSRGLPMVVPHGMLAKITPLEIIGRVRRGEIGELKLVEIQNTKWDIINAGIHWLNFFVQLTGNEPLAYVMGQADTSTRTYRDGMQVETAAITYAQTKSGIRVVMMTGDDVQVNREGKETLFRIVGTHGVIEFWGWENGYWLLNEAHPAGSLIVPEELPVTGHRRHLETMADHIERGTADYSLADSSLAALEIVEGAYLSANRGCIVTFPVDAFEPPAGERDWVPGIPYAGTGGGRNGRLL